MTKRVLLASVFALGAIVAPASAGSWTGVYIGGHVGGAWGDVDTTNITNGTLYWPLNPGNSATLSPDGVLGGAQLGYNFEASGWLFGVELSASGMDLDETAFLLPDDNYTVETEWLAIAAARIGWIWNQTTVFYVKGGYAAADIQTSESDTVAPNVGTFTTDETHSGWTAGAGFEHMISPDVSVGVEYNYIDLGSEDHVAVPPPVVNEVEAQLHAVTARLNWHFWSP